MSTKPILIVTIKPHPCIPYFLQHLCTKYIMAMLAANGFEVIGEKGGKTLLAGRIRIMHQIRSLGLTSTTG